MNAKLIVGYVTQPNGIPVSNAEIWISATNESPADAIENRSAPRRPAAKTNSRGYFQMPIVGFGAHVGDIFGDGGRLNIVVGAPDKSADASCSENFQLTGYLVGETAEAGVCA